MNQFSKNRDELVEIIKGAHEFLFNNNLPTEARALVRGSIKSSIYNANRGDFELAKSDIQNLHDYGIK